VGYMDFLQRLCGVRVMLRHKNLLAEKLGHTAVTVQFLLAVKFDELL